MKSFIHIFFLFVCFYMMSMPLMAQIQTYEEQVKLELVRRGLDENEVRIALFEEGYDLDNLEAITHDDIESIRIIINRLELQNEEVDNTTIFEETIEGDTLEIDTTLLLVDTTATIEDDSIELTIYGHELFVNGQISLINDDNSYLPPEDYIIGAGDELAIGIFGATRLDETYQVGQDGFITIYRTQNSNTGNVRVLVGGMTLEKAREKLITNFRRYYRFTPNQFTVTVSAVRKIRIQILGEVVRPGEFVVSGLNGIQNIIAAAGGFTDIGGVRQIKVNKREGRTLTFDVYKWLSDASYSDGFVIDNGDVIFVPAAQEVVELKGAIKRPHNYEILQGEGIVDVVGFAGGLGKGAFLPAFDLIRYEEDKKVYRQIPYASLIKNRQDFELQNGDEITIDAISERLENYVTLKGEVRNAGNFEYQEGMTIKDLVLLGELLPTARQDYAVIKRTNKDGKVNLLSVSIEDVLNDQGPFVNFQLQDQDEMTIWSLERYTDKKTVSVGGAVREPDSYAYDEGGTLRVSDLLILSGGLLPNATTYAHIHRINPFNPSERKYVKVDLTRIADDLQSVDNVFLEPYDSLHVYDRTEFLEDITITVSGAVNNPGSFAYGEGLTLRGAIALSGGFQLSSATNEVEVSRVIIKDNQATQTVVQKVSLSREEAKNFSAGISTFQLEPYDNVFVRSVPQFELQQNVTVLGEVTLPGVYSLVRSNETVYDIIQRAGGLTEEAFPGAAQLERTEDDLGELVMRLDEVMQDPSSRFNYALKANDTLFIPKVKDYVLIRGAARYLVQDNVKQKATPFHEGKNALFYIEEYAGGFADDARKDKIFVKYPNGEVKKTEKKLFGKKHPPVVPGAIIQIGKKLPDPPKSGDDENVNWTKIFGDSVAQATSILTLLLLIRRLD